MVDQTGIEPVSTIHTQINHSYAIDCVSPHVVQSNDWSHYNLIPRRNDVVPQFKRSSDYLWECKGYTLQNSTTYFYREVRNSESRFKADEKLTSLWSSSKFTEWQVIELSLKSYQAAALSERTAVKAGWKVTTLLSFIFVCPIRR